MKAPNLLQKHAWLRTLGVGVLCAAGGLTPAAGTILDRPVMKVDGVVVVWGADGANATPIASDFIIEDGGANTDLINGDVFTVVTGTLTAMDESFSDGAGAALVIQNVQGGPAQNTRQGDFFTSATDTLNPFGLRANTDVRTVRSEIESSFYVASNKAFNIDVTATSTGDPTDLNKITLRMRLARTGSDDGLSFGTAAQFPHSGNNNTAGVRWTGYRRLSTLTSGQNIFQGNRKTARIPGSLADQSVRFDVDYRWNTGNIDLAAGTFDIEADVEYTVYIP